MDYQEILLAILIFLATGGIVYALIYPYLSGDSQTEKRIKALLSDVKNAENEAEQERRDNVATTLKELDAREAARDKLTIEKRIAYSGLNWKRKHFYWLSFASSVIFAIALLIFTKNFIFSIIGFFVGGLGFPRWFLSFLQSRRTKKFINDLPSAIDVIVRGVRVGLPIRDCLLTIVTETEGAVQTEFKAVTEAMALGLPLREAIFRIRDNMPIPEANFIAIAISIQQVSGGNISTAFANLSSILRARQKMRDKINALSMEAKASAGIIGSLPFLLGGVVSLTTPDYLDPLFTTSTGNYILIGGAVWMSIGILVMRQMINFKI